MACAFQDYGNFRLCVRELYGIEPAVASSLRTAATVPTLAPVALAN